MYKACICLLLVLSPLFENATNSRYLLIEIDTLKENLGYRIHNGNKANFKEIASSRVEGQRALWTEEPTNETADAVANMGEGNSYII